MILCMSTKRFQFEFKKHLKVEMKSLISFDSCLLFLILILVFFVAFEIAYAQMIAELKQCSKKTKRIKRTIEIFLFALVLVLVLMFKTN